MAKYIKFEELQGAKLGLHQFPGTVGKHKLEMVSEKPGAIQVRGVDSQGDKTPILTLKEGQTLGYSCGRAWIVKPYAGTDPVRALLNKYHYPKDFVEYVPKEQILQGFATTDPRYQDRETWSWHVVHQQFEMPVWGYEGGTVLPFPFELGNANSWRGYWGKAATEIWGEYGNQEYKEKQEGWCEINLVVSIKKLIGRVDQRVVRIVAAHGTAPEKIIAAIESL